MKKFYWQIPLLAMLALGMLGAKNDGDADGCGGANTPRATSGVTKATTRVRVDAEGLTVEQKNVRDRLASDNLPGSIKHLYVISPYSGQVIVYSTVRGKVTSGGKRLTPSSVQGCSQNVRGRGFDVDFGNDTECTDEVLADDGAYGSSSDYIFWFDTKGVYHQHMMTGGQIIHVSSEPLAVKGIIINMELSSADVAKEETVPVTIAAPGKKP